MNSGKRSAQGGAAVGSRHGESDVNAKTAEDNNRSLGVGSEKQTQHQATGSASPGTIKPEPTLLGRERKRGWTERQNILLD